MTLRLQDSSLPEDLSEVVAVLRAAYPHEGCGVILHGQKGFRVVGIPNAEPSERAENHFTFSAPAWLRVLFEADERDEQIRCVFHSHLRGTARWSAEDERRAVADHQPTVPGATQLVVALDENSVIEARLYRWMGDFFAETACARGLV